MAIKLSLSRSLAGSTVAGLLLGMLLAGSVQAQVTQLGYWLPIYHEDFDERVPGPHAGDYAGLPINDAARLRADTWDPSLLTLWYEFDTAVRDRGEAPPIRLTVERLNDSLRTKFEPLRKHLPSPTRLREILSLAQHKNLLRFAPAEEASEGQIEILPTLKRVIPFQDIADWNRNAERQLAAFAATEAEETPENEETTA